MSASTILGLYLILLALELTVRHLLTAANMRHVRRLRSDPPSTVLSLMKPEEYRRTIDYTLARGRLALVSGTMHAAALALLSLTGWLGVLSRTLTGLAAPLGSPLASVLFVYATSVLFALLSLPFSLYSQFVIEARYGFNRMGWRLWALDTLKGLAVTLVIATPVLLGLFALVRASALWWLWGFWAFAALQVLMVYVYPKLIAPLFNRYSPLEEGPLKQRLDALAERLGVRTRGIYVVDGSRRSSHSNAYFSGFGKARRIVLFDTLIRSLSEEQVAAVLAHEIGHQRLRHVVSRLAVSLAMVAAGFWVLSRLLGYPPLFRAFGFSAPSAAAAVVLVLYFAEPLLLLARPLSSWWSRRQEFAADRYAQEIAGEGQTLCAALGRLSRDNLSNPTPHRWYSFVYYSHPPILERIGALERRQPG
jgi:STE24 endopeptidase